MYLDVLVGYPPFLKHGTYLITLRHAAEVHQFPPAATRRTVQDGGAHHGFAG